MTTIDELKNMIKELVEKSTDVKRLDLVYRLLNGKN